jgi:hypothetical protein
MNHGNELVAGFIYLFLVTRVYGRFDLGKSVRNNTSFNRQDSKDFHLARRVCLHIKQSFCNWFRVENKAHLADTCLCSIY